MPHFSRDPDTAPLNLCELLLRDVASLIVMSQLISRSLPALRQKCKFSRELTNALDDMVALSTHGEKRLSPSLAEEGAVLPAATDATTSALVTTFFTRLPKAENPGVLAAEIMVNLRLLAQHVELKSLLAAEAALLVGQKHLSHALVAWSAEWRACGRALRAATMRARARAYIADLRETPARQGA